MKVIAFSLWGEDTRYTLGALQNASLAKIVYPDWVCRFYVGKSTPEYIVDLLFEFDNVEIIPMKEEGDWTGRALHVQEKGKFKKLSCYASDS